MQDSPGIKGVVDGMDTSSYEFWIGIIGIISSAIIEIVKLVQKRKS